MYCRSVDPFKYEHGPYDVIIVPVLSDNYAYLVVDKASSTACAVDPAEADKVLSAAGQHGVTVTKVLTTHKHADHAGGNKGMLKALPEVEIVGSAIDDVEACNRPVADNEQFELGALRFTCLLTPGHTRGSMCYHLEAEGAESGSVFTGDTLFVGGCGRLFEGEAEDMWPGIESKLKPLAPDTKVWVGHEYTISNLTFALTVDKENAELVKMLEWAKQRQVERLPTIPSTIALENEVNPFMRPEAPALQMACGCAEPMGVFRKVRQLKNQF